MRTRLITAALALTLGSALPTAARAGACADRVIAGCDQAIQGDNPISTSLRGWCYVAGLANCALTEHAI